MWKETSENKGSSMASVEVVNSSNEKSGSRGPGSRWCSRSACDRTSFTPKSDASWRYGTGVLTVRRTVRSGRWRRSQSPTDKKARAALDKGTTRAPQFAGGGSVFGPVPRSHAHGSLKKVRRAALCSVISHRLAEGSLVVIEALEASEGKTREVAGLIRRLGIRPGERTLRCGIEEANESFRARDQEPRSG